MAELRMGVKAAMVSGVVCGFVGPGVREMYSAMRVELDPTMRNQSDEEYGRCMQGEKTRPSPQYLHRTIDYALIN